MADIVEKVIMVGTAGVIVIIFLNIITGMISDYCKTNQLFCNIVLFGGVLSAIVMAIKKIFK